MQVLDLIDKFEGRNIRIGTSRGSAYIWLGTVTDDLPAELMEVWNKLKRAYDARIFKLEKRLNAARHSLLCNNKEFILYPANHFDMKKIKESLVEVKKCRKECTNLLGREVVEVYASIFEPNTLIFIIEGSESGNAWYMEEWKKKHDSETKAAN